MASAAVSSGCQSRRDKAFASVFPPKDFTTPTPEATPNIGVLASPGRPFGGFNTSTSAATDDVVTFSRLWSTATRALTVPATARPETVDAFVLLCQSPVTRKELQAWIENDIALRFRHQVLPQLDAWRNPISSSGASNLLNKTVELLAKAHLQLLSPITLLEPWASGPEQRAIFGELYDVAIQKLRTLLLSSLPPARLQKTLAHVFYQRMAASLDENSNPEKCAKSDECFCSPELDVASLARMQDVGLGDRLGERAFAHAVHRFLHSTVSSRQCFQVDWSGQTTVIPRLRGWVLKQLAPFIENSLIGLTNNAASRLSDNEVNQLMAMALTDVGRQRTASLFDYVKSWPHSKGAILDIRECISSSGAAEKALVCTNFSQQLQHRLLHAGASTTEILSIYINMIHAFRALDARGVMLEKVAVPIRSYLRARDDTVSIIAASFLADVDEHGDVTQGDVERVCVDITLEVASSTLDDGKDHRVLNWDDMEWTPDPIDAGPDYKASRSEDILAYILNLFEQEDFVNEVKNVLAQHLLRADDPEYVKETRLVELFKSRLDATKLQAAEVMLKDVRDSVSLNKRINPQARYGTAKPPSPREVQVAIPDEGITLPSLYKIFEHRIKQAQFQAVLKLVANRRHDLYYPKRTRLPPEPAKLSIMENGDNADFNVQVLSSHFWPQMRASDFELPSSFTELANAFTNRFNLLGSQRKLHWRTALTRMTVELELEDRQVKVVDVQAWQASVIDAFSTEYSGNGTAPLEYDPELGLKPDQLAETLRMDAELVQDALNFWLSKRVLYRTSLGTYAVLERLDMDTGSVQQSAPPPADTISAVMSQNAMLREGAPMFETFIANMLRNGGPKEVGGMMGITSMMKMVLPTFTYGDEEVKWLLNDMEGKGEVRRNGEMWAAAG